MANSEDARKISEIKALVKQAIIDADDKKKFTMPEKILDIVSGVAAQSIWNNKEIITKSKEKSAWDFMSDSPAETLAAKVANDILSPVRVEDELFNAISNLKNAEEKLPHALLVFDSSQIKTPEERLAYALRAIASPHDDDRIKNGFGPKKGIKQHIEIGLNDNMASLKRTLGVEPTQKEIEREQELTAARDAKRGTRNTDNKKDSTPKPISGSFKDIEHSDGFTSGLPPVFAGKQPSTGYSYS